tara:strand:- start:14 stop:217 length:204 start_codon:yes stop_codon:yes gene_type:complete
VAVEVDFTVILLCLTYHKLVVLVVVALVDMVEVQLLMAQMHFKALVQAAAHRDILDAMVVTVVPVLL